MKLYIDKDDLSLIHKLRSIQYSLSAHPDNEDNSEFEDLIVDIEQLINSLTPIELPSDEKIEAYLKSFPYTKHLDDGQYNDGVIDGAELGIEWMREQIIFRNQGSPEK